MLHFHWGTQKVLQWCQHDGFFLVACLLRSPARVIHYCSSCFVLKVWFQNRRSKERRMKQLSTLGGRRHVFFRGQRRMRALGERLEADELGHFSYYGGEECWSNVLAFHVDSVFFSFFWWMGFLESQLNELLQADVWLIHFVLYWVCFMVCWLDYI